MQYWNDDGRVFETRRKVGPWMGSRIDCSIYRADLVCSRLYQIFGDGWRHLESSSYRTGLAAVSTTVSRRLRDFIFSHQRSYRLVGFVKDDSLVIHDL